LPRGVVGTFEHWVAQRRARAAAANTAVANPSVASPKPQPAE